MKDIVERQIQMGKERGMMAGQGMNEDADDRLTRDDSEPRVMHQIERCYDAINHQQKLIQELESHLGSVLRPDIDDSGEKAGPSPSRNESPMMGRMRDLEASIRYNSGLLNDLLIRLEV
jgi:hypothetical protein